MPTAAFGMPNAVTRILLCINTTVNCDYAGLLYSPYLPEPLPFGQIKDLLMTLDCFFDTIDYPQASFAHRSFQGWVTTAIHTAPHRYHEDSIFTRYSGGIATFEVEVHQRCHATWQGELYYRERKLESPFRSVLQLIRLIDSAISPGTP